MSVSGDILDRIENHAVSTVQNMSITPEQAVPLTVDNFRTAGILPEAPSSEQSVDLVRRVTARTSFPPATTPQELDDFTFSPSTPIDGSWVDAVPAWPHRDALRRYWDENTSYSTGTKDNFDVVAEHILRHSFDPSGGEYHWRGLVVGNIQSGKTATFTKLISRAFDAGYWTVIVLSGRLESLRRQTSNRLDRELRLTSTELGDREISHWTRYPDYDNLPCRGPLYEDLLLKQLREGRSLWILKKNFSVLDHMNDFFAQAIQDDPTLADRPVLIIDDECDEAGVDISQGPEDDEAEPTHSRVHFELRRLISNPESGSITWRETNDDGEVIEDIPLPCPGFLRTMLVGFTATPYACCFQELNTTEQQDEQVGRDLYPRDYILVLNDPPNYCGGEVFVGRHPVNVQDEEGEVVLSLPSFDPTPSDLLQEIPENPACESCMRDTVLDGDGFESHTHHRRNGHFVPGTCLPIVGRGCDCACHHSDEIHRVRSPFRECGGHFEPMLAPSLSYAVDRFVLSGAARAQRNEGHKPATMMVQVSNWRGQHPRLRHLIEGRLNAIREQYPSLGGHRTRLREVWEQEYRSVTRTFDDGFEVAGAGKTGEQPSRVFDPRARALDCPFEEIDKYILPFINQVAHVTLNSDTDETLDYAGHLQRHRTGLKAVVYGGFVLGRGLTLEGLVTSYFARVPGDQSVAMQLQRYCGYRDTPGEEILDLIRVYMPVSLAAGFSEMLAVECANRFRLGSYLRNGHIPPEQVGPRLQEAPGWELVSAAKRGQMIVEMNPYAGKEKSQTTYRFVSDEVPDFKRNWDLVREAVDRWTEGGLRDEEFDSDHGIRFRRVLTGEIVDLLTNWTVQPHKMEGFPRGRILEYIRRAMGHDELEVWNVLIPSLGQAGTTIELKYATSAYGDLGDYTNEPIPVGGGFEVYPFARAISQLYAHEGLGRIGTLTVAGWRAVEARDRESGLMIVVPVIHPFNRTSPGSERSRVEVTPFDRRFLPLEGDPTTGRGWPAIPALSLTFPGESNVRARELVHSQFASEQGERPGD